MFSNTCIGVLSGLLCTLIAFYVVSSSVQPLILRSTNRLLIASQVRDNDELRLAEANTQIGRWRLEKRLPLHLTQMFDYGGTHNFLILILTSRHQKVDAFEPYYLTQTSVALVKTLTQSIGREYSGIKKIIPVICVVQHTNDTDSDLHRVEIKRLRQVFGVKTILRPSSEHNGSTSNLCMKSCLSTGLKMYSSTNYVVILEDDYLVTHNFLPALDTFAKRAEKNLLQLLSPSQYLAYDSASSLILTGLYAFASLPAVAAFYLVYSRIGQKFIRCLLGTTLLVIAILLLLNKCVQIVSIELVPSKEKNIMVRGVPIVVPTTLATRLADMYSNEACPPNSTRLNGDIVAHFARRLKYNVLTVNPPAAIHIGEPLSIIAFSAT
ncbi:unnamed protein product [Mesocestoides corti]|uniref:Uncharacterized protein n=1 Tax=Mesocestoides corti TaxID=53468 RepID=A0A0R3UPL3_MESCO|nr:unnamed protein product [Mesocestoides corti]